MKIKNNFMVRGLVVLAMLILMGTIPLLAWESDAHIEAAFKQAYVYKLYLEDDAIKIDAKRGVVTLSGEVSDDIHRSLAQDMAEALPGVSRVMNQIVIVEQTSKNQLLASESKGTAPSKVDDASIRALVKMSLLNHVATHDIKPTIRVENGVIYLTGGVANNATKQLVGEQVKNVLGVKKVENNMRAEKK